MKPVKLLALGAFIGPCTILTAQPASQLSGTVDPEPTPADIGRFDADGDGKMSPEETKAMTMEMKNMAAMRQKMALEKFDADGDGKLSDDEKSAMEKAHAEMSKARQESVLKMYDKDMDGKLSEEESMAMYQQKGKDRKAMLAKYDKNQNGMLDADEMEAAGTAGDIKMDDLFDDSHGGQPQRKGSNAPSADD